MAYGVVHQFHGGTKEQYEASIDETLVPAMQRGVEGGFTAPPEEIAIDIDTLAP